MTPEQEVQARQDLLAAADVIERRGHVKGRFHVPDDGPCCLIGAIRVVVGLEHLGLYDVPPRCSARLEPACQLVRARLIEITGETFAPTVMWNDAAARTGAEVIALLRELGGAL